MAIFYLFGFIMLIAYLKNIKEAREIERKIENCVDNPDLPDYNDVEDSNDESENRVGEMP